MNKKPLILALLFILTGIFYYNLTGYAIQDTKGTVTRVIDGDTLEIDSGQKIRLLGINTPEKNNKGYIEAKELLTRLVENKSVNLKVYDIDKYGRLLSYVFLNNQNINELILKEGRASLYYYGKDNYYNDLNNAEEFARLNEKGIWEKSNDFGCLELVNLKYEEENRCTSSEKLEIKNLCNKDIEVTIKDDATHIYLETINANSMFSKNFSCIWNDQGDSIYIFDKQGLLMFYRYG